MIKNIIFFSVILFSQLSVAASFNCKNASSNVEKLICSNPQVSKLDEQLSSEYSALLNKSSTGIRKAIISEQRKWLKKERDNCQDESCLLKEYKSRIKAIKPKRFDNAGLPFIKTDVFENSPAPIGKGFALPTHLIDGDLVYSHFDDSGNAKNVVRLDFTSGRRVNLLEGKKDPKLIALDARHIVYHEPYMATFPIKVMDRKTGQLLSKKRLKNGVKDALIDGENLILFQAGNYRSQDGNLKGISIFKLPSLKLVKEIKYPPYQQYHQLVGITDHYVFTHYLNTVDGENSLIVQDLHLNELGRIPFPEPIEKTFDTPFAKPIEKINMNCGSSIQEDENDRAVLKANCGEMFVVNVKSFSIEQSIPRFARYFSMTLYKGLIFAAGKYALGQEQKAEDVNSIAVYDMETGKQIASLPITATMIASKGDILLAAGSETSWSGGNKKPYWPMATYQLNAEIIRAGDWQIERTINQCRKAQKSFDNNDIYEAINLCNTAGIETYAESPVIPEKIFPLLRNYALWLSHTFDNNRSTERLLKRLLDEKPDKELSDALIGVQLKVKVIEEQKSEKLTTTEQKSAFGRVLTDGDKIPGAVGKVLELGNSPAVFHFSENRIYVGRNQYNRSILVADRNTLDEIATISLTPTDNDDGQIISIVSDEHYIYVSVGELPSGGKYDEGPQTGVPNFLVIDKYSHQILKNGTLSATGNLFVDSGSLLSCGCNSITMHACSKIDLDELKLISSSEHYCIANEGGNETTAVVKLDKDNDASTEYTGVTKDYAITARGWGDNATYSLVPLNGDAPINTTNAVGKAASWSESVSDNEILISENSTTMGGKKFRLVSLPVGSIKDLISLPTKKSRFPRAILHRQKVYVGYGRDLLIFDIKANRLQRYIKDYIPNGFRDNGNGYDMNEIVRLIVDQDRLIAINSHGDNCRVSKLADL